MSHSGPTLTVRRLVQSDLVCEFRCGQPDLERFFWRWAKPNAARGLSVTWLAIIGGKIVGYVTVVPGDVASSQLAGQVRDLPRYPAPVLKVARLATSTEYQGRRIVGPALMRDVVFPAAATQRDLGGCVGVITEAKLPSVGFYRRYGFVPLEDSGSNTQLMFLAYAQFESLLDAQRTRAAAPQPVSIPGDEPDGAVNEAVRMAKA